MSIPESTLANPIIDAPYSPFLEVYLGIRLPSRNEVDRAASALLRKEEAPSGDMIRRHQVRDTPTLATQGEKKVEDRIAQEYLSGVADLVKEQESSIREFMRDISHCGEPVLPVIQWEGITKNSDLLRRWKNALYWLNVVDKVVQAARTQTW